MYLGSPSLSIQYDTSIFYVTYSSLGVLTIKYCDRAYGDVGMFVGGGDKWMEMFL